MVRTFEIEERLDIVERKLQKLAELEDKISTLEKRIAQTELAIKKLQEKTSPAELSRALGNELARHL